MSVLSKYFVRSNVVALSMFLGIACSDDEGTSTLQCGPNEVANPITGVCQPTGMTQNNTDEPNNMGTNNVVNPNNTNTSNNAPTNNTNSNNSNNSTNNSTSNPDERCLPGLDSDEDGLDNDCECQLGTNPYAEDTDADGLLDAEEDANGNCVFDPGETDPRAFDTDGDGLSDGEEIAANTNPLSPDTDGDGVPDGIEIASGCMDPLDDDSDGDGIPDGIEDANQDGELGTCPNRVYDGACAEGETDPCVVDTNGDGSPDSEGVQYRVCRPEDTLNLIVPQKVENLTADYQLIHDASASATVVTSTGPAVQAHVFEDGVARYTGFVISYGAGGQTNPSQLSDSIVGLIQAEYPSATRRVSGRRVTTHDGFDASVGSLVDLPAGTSLSAARDAILSRITGAAPTELSHGGNITLAGDASPTLFVHQVVSRSATQAVVVGAFVTFNDYQNVNTRTGFLVDDLTGGTSLAGQMDAAVEECVAYTVTTRPKVDIIISIDGSGSMSDEQQRLAAFVPTFTALLTNSNLDWRAGVTRPNCGDNDGLSTEMAALLQGNCMEIPFPIGFPFPGFGGKTGELVEGDFTSDPTTLENRLQPGTFDGGGEYTMTAVAAAADRALPRSDSDPSKIRTDAAVILIAIGDEEDELFQGALSFGNTTSILLTPTQETELETKTQPWIDHLLQADLGATGFGIVWPSGEACASGNASFVGHAVTSIANGTGGSVGSICQTDIASTLTEIANATAGIASGLRLRGTPLPTTLKVVHGVAATGVLSDMVRSRADGFDYDSTVNRVRFTGATPPQTGDRVVIPYRRWENSVFVCQTTDDCPATQKLKCIDGECR